MKHLILPSDVSASSLPYAIPGEQFTHSGFTSDQDLSCSGKLFCYSHCRFGGRVQPFPKNRPLIPSTTFSWVLLLVPKPTLKASLMAS